MSGARGKTTAREIRRAEQRAGRGYRAVVIVDEVRSRRNWRAESVFVATPTRNDTQTNYTISMMRMLVHDLSSHGIIARGGGPLVTQATPMNLPSMRNTMVTGMLDQTPADWLLWVDADAGFAPDIADQLVAAADPTHRPVLGALAFMVSKRRSDDMGGWRWTLAPTIYGWGPDESGKVGFLPRYDYPENTIVPVAATGCHMLLIHRSVLEKIRAEYGDTWFDRFAMAGHEDLGLMGEDFSFCVKARIAGFPVAVHTGIKTTHQQTVWVGEEDYQDALWLSRLRQAARAEAAEAAGEAGDAEPAPEPAPEPEVLDASA